MSGGSSSSTPTPSATLGNFSSPYGSVSTNKNGNISFDPTLSGQQQSNLTGTQAGIGDALNSLPTGFSVNDMYNNPYYGSTAAMLQQPIDRQYAQDQSTLANNLNAQNQNGSSYGALQNNYLNQNYQYNTNQAQLQARQASSDAYNQSINNALNAISGLTNSQTQQYNTIYQPLQYALQGQQNVNQSNSGNALAAYQQGQLQNQMNIGMLNAGATLLGGSAGAQGLKMIGSAF